MTDFNTPDDGAMKEAREAFVARQASREMLSVCESDTVSEGNGQSIAMSQLYAYADGRIAFPNPEIEAALAASPSLRAANARLLSAGATYEFDLARAASDGDLLPRVGEGCAIRYEDSRADRDHVYIVIEIDRDDATPSQLVLFDREDTAHRFDLSAPRRGIIQLLVERTSEMLMHLKDPATRVLLR